MAQLTELENSILSSKRIPIIILNRDRLIPLKKQVHFYLDRGYENITIIDNYSTYQPLLDWYNEITFNCNAVTVFRNNVTENSVHAFRDLVLMGHPVFVKLTSDWYVFNDSDIIPDENVPEDFIEKMIEYANRHNRSKVGLSIRIDDIDLNYPLNKWAFDYESNYWTNGIQDGDVMLYPHPIDTTFAVHAPNTLPTWSNDTLRVGKPYECIHAPFYYDPNNLPADERYYIEHLNPISSNWSSKVKI